MAVIQPAVQAWRFRNDDGSESAATWMAAAGTNVTVPTDTNIRLRFAVYTTSPGGANPQDRLQYRKNGGTWTTCDASSSNARMTGTANLTEGSHTTQQLLTTYTFSSTNYGQEDGDGAITNHAFSQNYGEDWEFCVQLRSADMAAGDYVEFRLFYPTNSTELSGSSPYPRATVQSAARNMGKDFLAFF